MTLRNKDALTIIVNLGIPYHQAAQIFIQTVPQRIQTVPRILRMPSTNLTRKITKCPKSTKTIYTNPTPGTTEMKSSNPITTIARYSMYLAQVSIAVGLAPVRMGKSIKLVG